MSFSKFTRQVIWFVVLTGVLITSFLLNMGSNFNVIVWTRVIQVIVIASLFIWSIGFTETLRYVTAWRYKIVVDRFDVKAKYLTSFWLFIPYWRPINEKLESMDMQNLFGATRTSFYSTEVTYRNRDDAIQAVNEHKQEIKENRAKWLKKPKPEKKTVEYM
jgi:hypothetical protein